MQKPLRFYALALIAGMITMEGAFAALDGNTVAEVNGQKISKDDFDRRYKEQITYMQYNPPTKANVLNDIINFEIQAQEAKKAGLEKDPQVQERMNAVLVQAYMERQLSEKFKGAVNVSDKEAMDYCRRNPAVRISHVFVPLQPAALKAEEEAAAKKIREAQAAINGGMKFEQAVAKFSEGFNVTAGGDTGYLTKVQLDPNVYKAARALGVGQVSSNPVRSQLGLHIVKLTGVQECNNINIPEWARMVFDEKRVKIREDYISGLRSRAKVQVNQALVKE